MTSLLRTAGAVLALSVTPVRGEVLVDGVAAGSPAEGAGLRAGDAIRSWHPAVAHDPRAVRSPFDLVVAEVEAGGDGVIVSGSRDGHPSSWTIPARPWGLTTAPLAPAWLLERRREAAGRRPAEALEIWRDAAARAEAEGDESAAGYARLQQGPRDNPPTRSVVADVFQHLGDLALWRGDLEAGERRLRRARALRAPDGAEAAQILYRLAEIDLQRLDLVSAARLFRDALAIEEKIDPEGPRVGAIHLGLGAAARLQNDWATAEAAQARALSLLEKASDHTNVVRALLEMAITATDQEQMDRAQALIDRAHALAEKHGLRSLSPSTLEQTGRIAWIRDEPEKALRFLEQAAARIEESGVGGLSAAEPHYALGWVLRQRGQTAAAAEHLCRVVDLVEGTKLRLGGSEDSRAAFASRLGDYASECLDALVELRREADAFQHLERARARRFLNLLAERDLMLAEEIPEDLREQARSVRSEYDRVQSQALKEDDPRAIETLRARLVALRMESDGIVAQIRQRSPRLAGLRYPEPLGLAAVQAALDPGTVMLSYHVTDERTLLFVVSKTSLDVYRLPLGRQTLQWRIDAFRRLLLRGRDSPEPPPPLHAQGAALFQDLVAPAAGRLAEARRILLCPDGPLHALPFGALVLPAGGTAGVRYLIEDTPLHVAISATVYTEQTQRRAEPSGSGRPIVAFGDPHYPPPAGTPAHFSDRAVQAALRGGLRLVPLPATRLEVEHLRRLFPETTAWMGDEATEERVKSAPASVRFAHFACHGYVDEAMPLNSGLALTLRETPGAGQDNGLLQAWEILESVRLDADLVTLSACDTGGGQDLGGEGLMGLTRAFHYAGARSVLSSLWSVADVSTSELMARFYEALRGGAAKDEALARAQRGLIGDHRFAHPFHWAAFQLAGDWK